jgi:hypothetical protein
MIARRTLLLAAAAAMLAGSALAAEKVVEAKKMFPYLEAFLKLPAAERTRFSLTYVFRQDGHPASQAMWIVEGATRTPLRLVEGRVQRLPTLAQLEDGKIAIAADPATKFSVAMDALPAAPPAAEMDARDLAAAVAQAEAGVRKLAGPLGFMAPKITEALFHGASGGKVRFADGRRAALPLDKGTPAFNPANLPGAVSVRFQKAPAWVELN